MDDSPNNAPISLTMVVLAVLIYSMLVGGAIGWVLASMSMGGFWGFFLSAFIPFIFGNQVRTAVARYFGHLEGMELSPPTAFTLSGRLAIGAVVAAVFSYILVLANFPFGFIGGATAAVLTSILVTVIFTANVFSHFR